MQSCRHGRPRDVVQGEGFKGLGLAGFTVYSLCLFACFWDCSLMQVFCAKM